MALIKTEKEIQLLRQGGRILARVLDNLVKAVQPGISTQDLEDIAQKVIRASGAEPAFPGYQIDKSVPPFPAALCTSINNEIVHGIPKKNRILKEGDIIGLDLGIKYKGLYTDAAVTVAVGEISPKAQGLIDAAAEALDAGIAAVRPGNTIGNVAYAIQSVARKYGFSVVRDLVGHGVGHAIHEKPYVPNYGKRGTLEALKTGMVLAIEPMFTSGDWRIKFLEDGWTVVTADGSIAAHFEHTVVVTNYGHLVLTVI